LHRIVDLDIVPVAGTTHIHNVLLIHNSRRAIVPGSSSKIAAVCYCLSLSICGADDTRKNRNMNVGSKGGPCLNLNSVGNARRGLNDGRFLRARCLNDGRVRGGDLNDGRVRSGDLNDGRDCSNGHNIMGIPDVATDGPDAFTNDPGVTIVRSRGRRKNLCPDGVCLVILRTRIKCK
jgi:hypothetical protein